jgi:colicin import membrane protein
MREAPYSIPKEPGRWRALGLALAVHLALLLFFWIGIDWQNETPVAVEAELWSPTTREAAPAQPQPEPEPKPEPKPEPVAKPQPKTEPEQPVAKNPDIALEKEKKRKELEKQKQAEKEKQQKLKQQAEQEKRDKEEKEKQKKLAEQKAEQQKKEKEKAEQQKKQDAIAKKIREEEMRRLTGAVGSGGAGQAAQSQGNNRGDASYGQKVAAKIRSNTIFNVPDTLSGNPAVEYDVELLPDGSVRSLRLNKSSGLPGFDEAVKRAIQASQPFPPDKTGRVPSGFTVVHKPKDQ